MQIVHSEVLDANGRGLEARAIMDELVSRYGQVRDPWGFRMEDLVSLYRAESGLDRNPLEAAEALRDLVDRLMNRRWSVGMGGEGALARRAMSELERFADSEWAAATRERIDDRMRMLYWAEKLLPEPVYHLYRMLLFAEFKAGIPSEVAQIDATDDSTLTRSFPEGVDSVTLAQVLALDEEIGNRSNADALLAHASRTFTQSGFGDLILLAILMSTGVPLVYYSKEAPKRGGSDVALQTPTGKMLLITNPIPAVRYSNTTRLLLKISDLRTLLHAAVARTAQSNWPKRKLLSGVLAFHDVRGGWPVKHIVVLYPCKDDFRVCDSGPAQCFDTIDAWTAFRVSKGAEASPGGVVSGLALVWDRGT